MFQTSLISLLCYPYLLFMSFMTNVVDICCRHVVILALRKLDHFSLSILSSKSSIYNLSMLSSSTSTFSGVITFCHF
jgi:hypothetical protein